MTLTNPNSPRIGQQIDSMIEDIKDNFTYLDSEPTAYCIKYFTKTISATGISYETISGVGFKPRIILFLAIGSFGDSCVGYYGPSTGTDSFSIYKKRILVGGAYSADQYNLTTNPLHTVTLRAYNDSLSNWLIGRIYSINDDGFVFRWLPVEVEFVPETYYVVALCIK